MSGLGEQIAVLDGLSALDPNDGRIGQQRARVNQYARALRQNVLARRNVIDASEGANYSGGSNYFPRGPLMPSSVGLADLPSVLPQRSFVVAPSNGYSGGNSYAPGLPLLPSNAGLANALIDGGYGRAGLGAALIDGGYGRAGLGGTGSAVDEDLATAAEAVAVARQLDPHDGRLGQQRSRVDQYGRAVRPGVLERRNVIDPSEGSNYSGGSNYFPRGPLMPSSVGLAGCGCSSGMQGFGATAPQAPAGQTLPVAWTPAVLTRRLKILNMLRNRLAQWQNRTNLTQDQALRVQYLQYIINSHAMSLIAHNPRNTPAMRLQAQTRGRQWDVQLCALRPRLGMPATAVCDRIARANALVGGTAYA